MVLCEWCKKKEAEVMVMPIWGWGPTPVCYGCLSETNEKLELEDDGPWLPMCPSCGGTGRYDDVVECPECEATGTIDY